MFLVASVHCHCGLYTSFGPQDEGKRLARGGHMQEEYAMPISHSGLRAALDQGQSVSSPYTITCVLPSKVQFQKCGYNALEARHKRPREVSEPIERCGSQWCMKTPSLCLYQQSRKVLQARKSPRERMHGPSRTARRQKTSRSTRSPSLSRASRPARRRPETRPALLQRR